MITGPIHSVHTLRRANGFLQALHDHGVAMTLRSSAQVTGTVTPATVSAASSSVRAQRPFLRRTTLSAPV